MTIYLDTSFLAPLFQNEDTSAEIETFIAGLPADALTVSQWVRVEFSSLLARKVRMELLDKADAERIDTRFELVIRESFHVLSPAVADFDLAKRYIARFDSGLRAGDALHLAIARNHRATAIYSLDKTMLKAGAEIGLPVDAGIRVR